MNLKANKIMDNLRESILSQIKKTVKDVFGKYPDKLELSFPPEAKMGDFTIECFSLAEQFGINPKEAANKLAGNLVIDNLILNTSAVGPYLNIKINNNSLFSSYINLIKNNSNLDEIKTKIHERIMVEYLSPNTNKPLHLGHLRNGAMGMAMSNIFEGLGNKVIKTNLINDRGVHICKSMLAWEKWGKGSTPESENMKGDHFVGKWYVRYNQELEKNPKLEEEAMALLRKWENGDPETIKRWETMNNWVYKGFNETYDKFGLKFDVFYFESNTYKLGKDIVEDGIKRGIFSKNEKGNIIFKLSKSEFGLNKEDTIKEVTVLRPDGTSVYITQDIATTVLKFKEHKVNRSIFVVGSEQNYHFKCLFSILKEVGYKWADSCYHLSYGMVYLPEGKMKSREGKVVDADDLINQMTELATEEIRKRDLGHKLDDEEIKKRASKIAVGAIKYYLLSVKPAQNIHFDPQASISFDGNTGPYCQYTYARIFGILDKAKSENIDFRSEDFSSLGNTEEIALLQKLIQFPKEIMLAAEEFNPSRITNHIFEISRSFNQFYNKHKVISDDVPHELTAARLNFIHATSIVLKQGLNMIGIDVLERM
ncbi:MAG: arginine--tRNA ligase [Patescibacteria group bacterium]|nr:arginine--tRNA ligase [Patescibacteria group bacterium]